MTADPLSIVQIIRPLLGRLTQGCLFTCARAENYGHCRVYGLVITARCDVEQDKYPILNYLPVVSLDDWLLVDGFDILHARLDAEADGGLKGCMKEGGVAESILFSMSPSDIQAAFFSSPHLGKVTKLFLRGTLSIFSARTCCVA